MPSFCLSLGIYVLYACIILTVRWVSQYPTYNKLSVDLDAANNSHRVFSTPSKIKRDVQLDILDEKTIVVSWIWERGELYGYFYSSGLPIPSREFKIAERVNRPYTVLKYGPSERDVGVVYQSGGYAWVIPSPTLNNNSKVERQFLPIFKGFSQLRFEGGRLYSYSKETGVVTAYYFGRGVVDGQMKFTLNEEKRSFIGFTVTDFYVVNDHFYTIRGGCATHLGEGGACRDGKFTSFIAQSETVPLLSLVLFIGLLVFPTFIFIFQWPHMLCMYAAIIAEFIGRLYSW